MGRFFGLSDAEQKRIALEIGAQIAPLLDTKARWDGGDEQVVVSGKYAGQAVRVRLGATFGTVWVELRPEPPLPRIGQIHLVQDADARAEQPETPPEDEMADPVERDDFHYYVSDTVSAGDNAADAAMSMDLLERLPRELKRDLLAALEPPHSHFNAYSKEVQLRCGGEPLGDEDVLPTIKRYLDLLLRMHVALAAIWEVSEP
jgi:hypothetical protein